MACVWFGVIGQSSEVMLSLHVCTFVLGVLGRLVKAADVYTIPHMFASSRCAEVCHKDWVGGLDSS